MQYYCLCLKSREIYQYIAKYLVNVAIANAYILSQYIPSERFAKTFLEFKTQLARERIGNYNSQKSHGRPSLVPHIHHQVMRHYPMKKVKHNKHNLCYNKRQLT